MAKKYRPYAEKPQPTEPLVPSPEEPSLKETNEGHESELLHDAGKGLDQLPAGTVEIQAAAGDLKERERQLLQEMAAGNGSGNYQTNLLAELADVQRRIAVLA